ncbi:adenosylcobinamide-GDP ribazoletransferase [Aquincola sp. MAHUQ-54]|uniref:Adenosylcobinamide-GDP ribazoletransferase n=1 Tax=Aquincola agrisoli TaxID=3119538 RepID=A0AAW9QFE5_9BURK
MPRAGLRHELRLVAVALQFLTRVPVRLRDFDPAWLHACARHFPLVGAGVGALGAAVLFGALQLWPAPVAVLLSMAATVWLTGGFHEDGLADTCDGLGGAVARERALAIMKDSRLGSYGALGLVLTLALKAAALCVLASAGSAGAVAAALVMAHGVSRAAAVALLVALPYAGDPDHAKAKPFAQQVGAGSLGVALGWAALLAAGAVAAGWPPARVAASLAAVAGVAWVCAGWLRRRLGGYTGDGLGATQQWTELAAYLALAAQVA